MSPAYWNCNRNMSFPLTAICFKHFKKTHTHDRSANGLNSQQEPFSTQQLEFKQLIIWFVTGEDSWIILWKIETIKDRSINGTMSKQLSRVTQRQVKARLVCGELLCTLILSTVLYTFPKVLTRRICLTINQSFN